MTSYRFVDIEKRFDAEANVGTKFLRNILKQISPPYFLHSNLHSYLTQNVKCHSDLYSV
jgi:hypothetical protein